MTVVYSDTPSTPGEPVLFRGDDVSAVSWVNKFGGTRDARAVFIIRWLGALKLDLGWCFQASHISGVDNGLMGGISSHLLSSLEDVSRIGTSGGEEERHAWILQWGKRRWRWSWRSRWLIGFLDGARGLPL